MTRLIIYIILLSALVACDEENGCFHDIPHECYILTGDLENGNIISLSSLESASELSGLENELLQVSYFYTRKCKDSLLWEEGVLKVPIKNR